MKSVTPIPVKKSQHQILLLAKYKPGNSKFHLAISIRIRVVFTQHAKKVLEKVDSSELNHQQQMIATQMLIEEAETFSVSGLDVKKESQPQMKILPQNPPPVQRN